MATGKEEEGWLEEEEEEKEKEEKRRRKEGSRRLRYYNQRGEKEREKRNIYPGKYNTFSNSLKAFCCSNSCLYGGKYSRE